MKKYILLLSILLFPIFSYSQLSFGIKLGVNMNQNANLRNKSNEVPLIYNERYGYVIGVTTQLDINQKISLNSGISISEKGWYLGNAALYKGKNLHLTYGIIPLLIGYKITRNIQIQTGLEFGYLFDVKVFSSSGYNGYDYFDNNIDLSLNFGVNYSITKRIGAGLNYSYSLIPAYKYWTARFPETSTQEFKTKSVNKTFSILFFYKLK